MCLPRRETQAEIDAKVGQISSSRSGYARDDSHTNQESEESSPPHTHQANQPLPEVVEVRWIVESFEVRRLSAAW